MNITTGVSKRIMLILWLILFFQDSFAYKIEYNITFNTDIIVCPHSVNSLTQTEQVLFPKKPLDLLISSTKTLNFVQQNLQQLFIVSPQRAIFLNDLIGGKIPQISFKENVQINRFNPVAALVIPDGCRAEPIAMTHVALAPALFYSVINKNLFDKMNATDQFLTLMELGLNIEQALDSLKKFSQDPYLNKDVPFDLVKDREFLRCWYSSQCRSLNLTLVQAHQLFEKLNLSFIEQSGFLLPITKSLTKNKKGLVAYAYKTYPTFKPLEKYFNSKLKIQDKVFDFSNWDNSPYGNFPQIIFSENGTIQCIPLYPRQRVSNSISGVFNGKIYTFTSSNYYDASQPVCWNSKGQITQGFIPFKSLEKIAFSNQFINGYLESWDDYNKDRFGIFIRTYADGTPKTLYHFNGYAMMQNLKVTISGPVKLRKNGQIECARIISPGKFRRTNGTIYKNDPRLKEIFCFNENYLLTEIHSSRESSKLINSEWPEI
jgi:hypothetical protein